MIWFIKYLSAVTFLWNYYGLFVDWMLDEWFEYGDEWLWLSGLTIIGILSLAYVVGVYR